MAKQKLRYRLSTDSLGLAVIEIKGQCVPADVEDIETGCTRRYVMVPIPNSSGAVIKALDGTSAKIVEISPPTFDGRLYRCVKVDGRVNPFAPRQAGGSLQGEFVLDFYEKYQEVGGVA